ncbi:MAG TPA: tetratricopeptide repeat protein [Verrucomicrobiae bacterium]|nr:tetratricopeptide repeat protein [Verrucomicrobiae bacterium]
MKTHSLACALAALLLTGLVSRGADAASEWQKLKGAADWALLENDNIKAEALLLPAVEKAKQFGMMDRRYAETLRMLIQGAREVPDFATADSAVKQLLAVDAMRLGTNSTELAIDLLYEADVATRQEDFPRAQNALTQSSQIVEKSCGPLAPPMGFCYFTRGNFELPQKHFSAAETNYQKALELLEKSRMLGYYTDTNGPVTYQLTPAPEGIAGVALYKMAVCQRQEGNHAAAEASLQKSINIVKSKYGHWARLLVDPLLSLAEMEVEEGKLPEAEKAVKWALGALKSAPPTHPLNIEARELLDDIKAEKKKKSAAK